MFFLLGTNDSKQHNWNAEGYETAVKGWIGEMKRFASHPRILLAVPPAAFSVDGRPVVYAIRNEVIRDEIRPILTHLAQGEGVELLDLYEASSTHPEYFADGVHPNAAGNRAIAEWIVRKINETGAKA